MPQDTVVQNHMFGFKGTYCARHNYNRVRYKKWPWVSFLVATICIGIIFFIAGSPANIHQMTGGALVLCSILLALGTLLLVPSTVIVFYLGIYFLMVYFNCSTQECCGRPIEWARKLNEENPEDQILVSTIIRDENDNPTNPNKNKKKQEQSSASRNKPEQLSVPAIMAHSNNVNHVSPDKRKNSSTPKTAQPNAHSVYSVQTDTRNNPPDNAYHQRKTQEINYNHVRHNHAPKSRSRDGRGTPQDGPMPYRGRPDGDGSVNTGFDNPSFDQDDEDDDLDSPQRHKPRYQPSVHSYGRSAGSYPDSVRSQNGPYSNRKTPRSVYGVSRAPNLDVEPRTANNHKDSQDPPLYPNPPIDARVNVVTHPVLQSSPRSSRSHNPRDRQNRQERQDRSRTKRPINDSTAIEMDDYSPQRKTLAEHAKGASKRPPPQVRGYRSTSKVSGYLETSMNDGRAGSSMSDRRSDNFNVNNNKQRSRTSKPF